MEAVGSFVKRLLLLRDKKTRQWMVMEQSPVLWKAKEFPHLQYYRAFDLSDEGREQAKEYADRAERTEMLLEAQEQCVVPSTIKEGE